MSTVMWSGGGDSGTPLEHGQIEENHFNIHQYSWERNVILSWQHETWEKMLVKYHSLIANLCRPTLECITNRTLYPSILIYENHWWKISSTNSESKKCWAKAAKTVSGMVQKESFPFTWWSVTQSCNPADAEKITTMADCK